MIRWALLLVVLLVAACGSAPTVSSTTPSSAMGACREAVRDGWQSSPTESGEIEAGRRIGIWKLVRGGRLLTVSYRESGAFDLLEIMPAAGADPDSARALVPPALVVACPPPV